MENVKFNKFLDNAQILNKRFGITPLLYGSLGLEVLTDSDLSSDDIDILIPSRYVEGDDWEELKQFLEQFGYVLIDEHEHTFLKDDIHYSYAKIEGLKNFANTCEEDIKIYQQEDAQYKLLSLEQYLRVYESSLSDEYRMNVFKKSAKDKEKILFIKSKLNMF
ncbi:MAG: hypothetical protein IJO43_02590 [Bacilli bacterium]|nr:hypothetical protein [Bacilli bacterium]